jgi:hypothetical protein
MAAIIVAIVIVAIVILEIAIVMAVVICVGELHIILCYKMWDTTATLVA